NGLIGGQGGERHRDGGENQAAVARCALQVTLNACPTEEGDRRHPQRQEREVGLEGIAVDDECGDGDEQERRPQRLGRESARERNPESSPGGFYAGFHRNTGLREAVTSSTRLVRVPCGAVLTICGSVSISLAIEIIASMNRSISCLPSVSVGSIMRAPCTING